MSSEDEFISSREMRNNYSKMEEIDDGDDDYGYKKNN